MEKKDTIWDENITDIPKFKVINKNISTDVCIIGGGITGVGTAYYLNKNNVDFILLEKDTICNSTTKYSTAKITSQHNLIYSSIMKKYGINIAKLYLDANNNAIKNIIKIIEEEKINCDLQIEDSFVFTQDTSYIKNLEDEYFVLNKLEFNNCELVYNIKFPIGIKCALKFKNQAKFNPKKYVIGLASKFNNNIFENSKVTNIKKVGEKYNIFVNNCCITCNKVVLATHFPIKDIPGFYFLKMYQDASYVIAANIKTNNFNGIYINVEDPSISLRTLKMGNENIMLVGGNNIKVGDNIEKNKYESLENIAKSIYPDCQIIKKWNTQDCISLDQIPYIGNFSSFLPNMYIATGFNKWGITTSNIAANIITDKILGRHNKYEKVFIATRFHPIKNIKNVYYNIVQTLQSLIINKFKIKPESIENIPKNTGKIIKINGKNIGVYKDENNKVYKINPYCSHLGCLLTFNIQDKTWDCPCHGSRFDIHGNIINNPANEKI